MSVTFSGLRYNPEARHGADFIHVVDERGLERYFNLCNANALAFLRLLQLDAYNGLIGSVPIMMAVRAAQCARASFDYRVDAVCRKDEQGCGANGATYFAQGVDEAYFVRRLGEFEELLADLILAGADTLSWG